MVSATVVEVLSYGLILELPGFGPIGLMD